MHPTFQMISRGVADNFLTTCPTKLVEYDEMHARQRSKGFMKWFRIHPDLRGMELKNGKRLASLL